MFQRHVSDGETTVRARVVFNEGWTEGRWGYRTRVRVVEARTGDKTLRFPPRCRLEVRGHQIDQPLLQRDLLLVGLGALHRIARIAQIHKIHAFHNAPAGHVQAGYDSFSQHIYDHQLLINL